MALYLLDTTTLTHLYQRHARVEANYLLNANHANGDSVGVASINVEEVVSGWLNYLNQAKTVQDQVNGSRYLNDAIRHLSQFTLYDVTAASIARHAALRGMKLNVGRNDLAIGRSRTGTWGNRGDKQHPRLWTSARFVVGRLDKVTQV